MREDKLCLRWGSGTCCCAYRSNLVSQHPTRLQLPWGPKEGAHCLQGNSTKAHRKGALAMRRTSARAGSQQKIRYALSPEQRNVLRRLRKVLPQGRRRRRYQFKPTTDGVLIFCNTARCTGARHKPCIRSL